MKGFILVMVVFWGTVLQATSQKVINKKIDVPAQNVEMKLSFARDIQVEAWNNNYVNLEASVNIDNNRYNDYYGLHVFEKSNQVQIEEDVDFKEINKLLPGIKDCNFQTEISYKLKIPQNLNFTISTISGEIELIGCEGEISAKSVSGFIDYSIPERMKARFDLSTVTGVIYSNVQFDNKAPCEISWVVNNQALILNGGSKPIKLKTVSGDIYLRKL